MKCISPFLRIQFIMRIIDVGYNVTCTNTSICIFSVHRGKGDYYRLGHGTDAHVRKPQLVEGLKGKKIVHVAVGALHCLAVSDNGQVTRQNNLFIPSAHLSVQHVCKEYINSSMYQA